MDIRSTIPDLPAAEAWRGVPAAWPPADHPDAAAERVLRLFSPADAAEDEAAMDALVSRMMPGLHDPPALAADGLEETGDGSPLDPAEYLDRLEARVVSAAGRMPSPRFLGPAGAAPFFAGPLLRLAAALGPGSAGVLGGMERQALARLHRLVYGMPDAFYAQASGSALGMVTPGGASATVAALACARDRRLAAEGAFRGVRADGMAAALVHHGCRGLAVIGSARMDASYDAAMGVLGLGTGHLYRVPSEPGGGVDLRAVRAAVDHCRDHHLLVLAVVGVAGSADAGSVDDLHALADVAAECGAHFHADASGSGATLFSELHRPLLAGMERADTAGFDGHAQLYLPAGIGILLLRDPALAPEREAHGHNGHGVPVDGGRGARDGSPSAAPLLLHAALELVGERGYAALAEEGIRRARYLADAVRARPEFELLCEPRLNVVIYRYVPQAWRARARAGTLTREAQRRIGAFNEALQRLQCERGCAAVSHVSTCATVYGPHAQVTALRAVLANPLTTADDIDFVLDDQAALAQELAAALG